jgi:F0F1-type ATP synthase membrane subunit b/b'
MTQTDQMNQQEVSFRSDEQAQSQDRERLQSEIQEAWDRLAIDAAHSALSRMVATASDIKLLKWALGVK